MSTISSDGNDRVTISGSTVNFSSDGKSLLPASLPSGSGGIIIPAGNGNNVIDLSGLSMNGIPTVTYTGTGTDVIKLPSTGVHVVFAGEFRIKIKIPVYNVHQVIHVTSPVLRRVLPQ